MSEHRVLITGACGFLGSVLVVQAAEKGMHVIATDRTVLPKSNLYEFIAADILDPMSLSRVFHGVDCVCHVAGLAHIFNSPHLHQDSFYEINVVGTENIVRAAIYANVKNFVFISSVSVYGGVAKGKDEDSECHPQGPYAESKWQAERLLIDICTKEKVNLTILRLTTLYGEEDPGNVGRLIRLIDRGRFVWIGRGENLKSLLYREDAARACVSVLMSKQPGIHIYNLTSDECKMSYIVQQISSLLEKPIPSWHIPKSLVLTVAKFTQSLSFNHAKVSSLYRTLQKWVADDYYNADKFCRNFDFHPNVEFEEGIRREVTWYRNKLSMR